MMTPEEREQSELELIRQYSDAVQCLNILHHKLRESLGLISAAFAGAYDSGGVNFRIPPATLDAADGLRALVEDYRATHDRCTQLWETLSGFPVITPVPHKRF